MKFDFLTARIFIFVKIRSDRRHRNWRSVAYRASGLNPLVAEIILWNTRHLERTLANMACRDEVARHIATHGCEHIALTGDFIQQRGPASASSAC